MTTEPLDPRVDRSRSAVYLAEDHVAAAMDSPVRAILLDGEVHTLPPPLHFGTLVAMQEYADRVLDHPDTAARFGDCGGVRVRPARGFRRATYRSGVISIPAADRRGRWALRDTVLLHELAHHLTSGDAHGPKFRSALTHLYRIHIDPGAAAMLARGFAHLDGLPDPDATPPPVDGPGAAQLRRVAALLAKAESTTHPDEAEAYLARAGLLAQRHSIDLAVAALGPAPTREQPTRRMISLGEPRRALNARFAALLTTIARAWGARIDIGPSSAYVIVYGMPSDLDRVESVYATAATMMIGHAAEHVRAGGWRGTTYWATSGARKPVTATVARNAFCLGFTERLGQRLREAQATARAEAAAGPPQGGPTERSQASDASSARPGAAGAPSSSPGVASTDVELALARRVAEVTDYHRATSRARGTWRGAAGGSHSATGSRAAGRRAAEMYGAKGLSRGSRAIEAG